MKSVGMDGIAAVNRGGEGDAAIVRTRIRVVSIGAPIDLERTGRRGGGKTLRARRAGGIFGQGRRRRRADHRHVVLDGDGEAVAGAVAVAVGRGVTEDEVEAVLAVAGRMIEIA